MLFLFAENNFVNCHFKGKVEGHFNVPPYKHDLLSEAKMETQNKKRRSRGCFAYRKKSAPGWERGWEVCCVVKGRG